MYPGQVHYQVLTQDGADVIPLVIEHRVRLIRGGIKIYEGETSQEC